MSAAEQQVIPYTGAIVEYSEMAGRWLTAAKLELEAA